MMKTLYRIVVIIALAVTAPLMLCSCGDGLKMNYSSADITPEPYDSVMLAGFAARKHLSQGIHQHLFTHCLVLMDKGGQKVCLISNDLMEISPALTDSIRTAIAQKSGLNIDNILVHNIHTHSAPRSSGSTTFTGGPNRLWKFSMMETMIENAVKTITANDSFKKFKLQIGKGTTDINGNRCEADGPLDNDVYVARFLQHRKPVVSIVNVACHPVCMGPKSYLVSSDYPGIAGKMLSKAWGGEVFQLTGAAGNMDPAKGPQDSIYAEIAGRSLAASIVHIPFTKVKDRGLLRLVNETVDLPYQIDSITPEAVMHHADSLALTASKVSATFGNDVRGWEKEILARFDKGPVPNKLRFHLHALDINGIIFFFTDGEPFCEYQMVTRNHFPNKTIFFAGYTDGQNSYLPSKRAYEVRKGYEYEVEQMHIYIKAPYPLSERMPDTYISGVEKTIKDALESETK
jgi:hypothetical protein